MRGRRRQGEERGGARGSQSGLRGAFAALKSCSGGPLIARGSECSRRAAPRTRAPARHCAGPSEGESGSRDRCVSRWLLSLPLGTAVLFAYMCVPSSNELSLLYCLLLHEYSSAHYCKVQLCKSTFHIQLQSAPFGYFCSRFLLPAARRRSAAPPTMIRCSCDSLFPHGCTLLP